MPIRFFCDHCRQMLKIGTSKTGNVVSCPRCHKPVVVPPQSVPQAEQLYQMLKKKRAEEAAAHPVPNNIVPEPSLPESAWEELGGNVNDADLNQWIDELWKTNPANPQESSSGLFSTSISNPVSNEEVALFALQKQHKLTVTLLYVSATVAFFVGIVFGILLYAMFASSTRSYQHLADSRMGTNEITGTLFYRNENGDRWPDVEAAIICLPMDRPMVQLLFPQGLRPGDDVNNDTVQLIQEMGGMYARGDVNGSFTLQYREGVRYFVILISAHQKRSGEMKPSVLQELRRYFRNYDQFGGNCLLTDEYEWSGGKYSFRHTFEFGE